QASRILMEDVPFVPLYTLAEIYGVARNIIWQARPDEKVLSADMKIRSCSRCPVQNLESPIFTRCSRDDCVLRSHKFAHPLPSARRNIHNFHGFLWHK